MTAHAPIPLFRTEVLAARKDRLHGDVSLAVPMSWQLIGYLLLAALAAALLFLSTATYSRVETVTGAVVVDKGMAAIIPSRPGVIADLPVREGQEVAAGQRLASIRAEEDMAGGGTAPQRVIDALHEQEKHLASQAALMLSAGAAERDRLAASAAGARQEIAGLDQQILHQQRLIALAETDFAQVQEVAAKGFLSRKDLDGREATLLARRQQLSQMQQARAVKLASLTEAERMAAQSTASARAQAAAVGSQQTEVVQQVAQAQAAKGYELISPTAGTVTAITARLGQPAAQGQQLMTVVPMGGRLQVELAVPTSAAGFLRVGQDVRLAIDAFPYQQFGTIPARLTQIAAAPVGRPTDNGGSVPVYVVTAELGRTSVEAFGAERTLVPGMSLSARIVTRRQTLLEWLFEPLFAVGRR